MKLPKRQFIKKTAVAAAAALSIPSTRSIFAADRRVDQRISEYLESIAPTKQRIEQFTTVMSAEESIRRSNGWTYHGELGWVHCPAVHRNGVGGSRTFYSYESDGARKVIHYAKQPCRIHAYGNSFTHCDQVSDGETWEEYLAAHLQEPIRNYGVGGFSVYQAYRRMRLQEAVSGSEYLILNIFEDDHFRNLDAWRSIRVGAGSSCGFTLPHVRVHMASNQCQAMENLLLKREEVARLRHSEFRDGTFHSDPILKVRMLLRQRQAVDLKSVLAVAQSFGFPENELPDSNPKDQLRHIHTEAALFATSQILEWVESFAKQYDKKLMLILSFGQKRVREALEGRPAFDASFLRKLGSKTYPVVDLRHAFTSSYESFKGDPDTFLSPYYIGHHTPLGNFFTARAIRKPVSEWLNPPAAPYVR